ncbi:MAG: N-acetyl-gamma-glutamyl-phosphate reductase [Pseudomonadota bacterium]
MKKPFLIGLIGARGYTGRELIRLIARHPSMMLAYASSRELAGKPVSEIAPEITDECLFENIEPDAVAARRADAVILALPDGAGAPFVEAFERIAPQRVLLDLSADKRFDDTWVYGLPELDRKPIQSAKRIANPGCYATAAQLALAPVIDRLDEVPSVFGVSGYSGAGSKPNPRNDITRLSDNLMPYAVTGHKHEREVAYRLKRSVMFTPHVHQTFRGLLITVHGKLSAPMAGEEAVSSFKRFYEGEPLVDIVDEPPELSQGSGLEGARIGGISVSDDGHRFAVICVIDNLLKGAAVQAVQNLNLALGCEELAGLH